MANDITHVSIKLDQLTLQTLKMGLAQLQMAAQAADAYLTQSVQAVLDEAAKPPAQARPRKPLKEANGAEGIANGHATL